ncbi:MAG: tRNA lysidine(34) synthetase TilS [Rubrobacter sp.]|nr:tRNA lysidine(34) synthetase TilS [Rubrobacter sp.]
MNPEPFLDAVARTAERYEMDLACPLVMVSGGPDSVALLRSLLELGSEPVVLHVDHGLRGDESRGDREFVVGLCESFGVPCEVRELDLRVSSGVQEEARGERYRLAEEVADVRGLPVVATGHTADDVAETVLMNLARGAGLRGVAGIPPVRGRFVRPVIERRRTEVLDYLARNGQPYRTDPTNTTDKYSRNRVRLEALPLLEDLYPGAGANIARCAALAREDLEALETLAARVPRRRGGEVLLPPEALESLPHALRRYAVRRAYSMLVPASVPPLDLAAVERVLALIPQGEGTRTLDLPEGIVAAGRPGGELVLYAAGVAAPEGGIGLRPGESRFGGWSIAASEVTGFEFSLRDAARPEVAYLDASHGPYRVRAVREGDTVRPLGLGGTKKVLRALMDRKVPADLRRRTPVVVDGGGRVAWVFLGELGEEFRVTAGTQRALRLEVREAGGEIQRRNL